MMRAGLPDKEGTSGPGFPQPAQSSSAATNRMTTLLFISFPTLFMKTGGARLRAEGTVPAAALAAVPAPQVVHLREDDVPALAVEVQTLDERPPLLRT